MEQARYNLLREVVDAIREGEIPAARVHAWIDNDVVRIELRDEKPVRFYKDEKTGEEWPEYNHTLLLRSPGCPGLLLESALELLGISASGV